MAGAGTISLKGSVDCPVCAAIVGVVQDGKHPGLNEDPKPFFSRPPWQSEVGATSVIVRAEGDEERLKAAISREVQQLDANLPMSANTLVEKMSLPLLPARIAPSVLGGFGLRSRLPQLASTA